MIRILEGDEQNKHANFIEYISKYGLSYFEIKKPTINELLLKYIIEYGDCGITPICLDIQKNSTNIKNLYIIKFDKIITVIMQDIQKNKEYIQNIPIGQEVNIMKLKLKNKELDITENLLSDLFDTIIIKYNNEMPIFEKTIVYDTTVFINKIISLQPKQTRDIIKSINLQIIQNKSEFKILNLYDIYNFNMQNIYYFTKKYGIDDVKTNKIIYEYKQNIKNMIFLDYVKYIKYEKFLENNVWNFAILQKLGEKRVLEINKKPLSLNEKELVKNYIERTKLYALKIINNRCQHIQVYKNFINTNTKNNYEKLQAFFKNDKYITCKICELPIMCSHEKVLIENRDYIFSIKNKLSKFLINKSGENADRCNVCGEVLLDKYDNNSEYDNNILISEDLENYLRNEILYVMRNIEITKGINMGFFIKNIINVLAPIISNVFEKISKSKIIDNIEIKAKKHLYTVIYINAALIKVILDGSIKYKNSSATTPVDLIKFAIDKIVSSLDVTIREIQGMTTEIIKNTIVDAYKIITKPIYQEKNEFKLKQIDFAEIYYKKTPDLSKKFPKYKNIHNNVVDNANESNVVESYKLFDYFMKNKIYNVEIYKNDEYSAEILDYWNNSIEANNIDNQINNFYKNKYSKVYSKVQKNTKDELLQDNIKNINVGLSSIFDENGIKHKFKYFIKDGKLDAKCEICDILKSNINTLNDEKIRKKIDINTKIDIFYNYIELNCINSIEHKFKNNKCELCGYSKLFNSEQKETFYLENFAKIKQIKQNEQENKQENENLYKDDIKKYDIVSDYNVVMELADKTNIKIELINSIGSYNKQNLSDIISGIYIPTVPKTNLDLRIYKIDYYIRILFTEYNKFRFYNALSKSQQYADIINKLSSEERASLSKKPDILNEYYDKRAYVMKNMKPQNIVDFMLQFLCSSLLYLLENNLEMFVKYILKNILKQEEETLNITLNNISSRSTHGDMMKIENDDIVEIDEELNDNEIDLMAGINAFDMEDADEDGDNNNLHDGDDLGL